MIVAIFGYKGCGKSAVAKRFELHDFIRRPIAAPLKEMLKAMGVTQEQLWGDEKEKPSLLLGGKTARHAMQTLGTEWGRNTIHPDVWIRAWAHTTPMDKNIVVDDLRFPNEADHLISLGAYFVKVERPGTEPTGTLHESEAYVDRLPWDLRIVNNGSLDMLTDYVKAFMSQERTASLAVEGERVAKLRQTLESL